MARKYKKALPNTTYKKQLLKTIWSSVIVLLVFTAKNIENEYTDEFINITKKIVNYDLKLNDKRIINMRKAITSFSIKVSEEEYSTPMQGTIYKKYDESKTGIDIVAYKEFVRSIGSGEVINVEKKNTGIDIFAKHGELEVVYGNMEKVNVKSGEKLLKGHILGSMGDISKKNKYFHFEVWKNGSRVDPLEYIKANNQTPLSYE